MPAGTIRLVPSKGKLTRLAVLQEYRSHGAGAELVRAMEDWLVQEVKRGKLGHLVNDDGRHGRSVHVKVHSQVSRRSGGGASERVGDRAQAYELVDAKPDTNSQRNRGPRDGGPREPRERKEARRTHRARAHAQIPVVRFYAKLGYKEEGPRFDEEGEPHQLMVRDIDI